MSDRAYVVATALVQIAEHALVGCDDADALRLVVRALHAVFEEHLRDEFADVARPSADEIRLPRG
jgi:hypothetical protein